jgi:hypothetical protein
MHWKSFSIMIRRDPPPASFWSYYKPISSSRVAQALASTAGIVSMSSPFSSRTASGEGPLKTCRPYRKTASPGNRIVSIISPVFANFVTSVRLSRSRTEFGLTRNFIGGLQISTGQSKPDAHLTYNTPTLLVGRNLFAKSQSSAIESTCDLTNDIKIVDLQANVAVASMVRYPCGSEALSSSEIEQAVGTSKPYFASRSKMRNRGASLDGNASRNFWTIHILVGCFVTLKCRMRRRE